MNESSFHSLAQEFLGELFKELAFLHIKIKPHWDIDHLCYRVENLERYEILKQNFVSFSRLLTESEVSGRPIATFKLNSPVIFDGRMIDVVELPAPKPGKLTPEGFEHIEVVVDVPFAELEKQYGHLNLDRGGLRKDFNQELEICLGARNLKFHHLSLESVVNLEKNTRVFKALEKSRVLSIFRKYQPLVAGTFPLDLAVENSDLDILLNVADLDLLETELVAEYKFTDDLRVQRSIVDELETLIANFSIDGVPFEVFAQNKESVKQTAYRHFLIEERLLKTHGPAFQQKVRAFRAQGLKTEPAFARALNLAGDPYLELLRLQKEELKR